MRMIGLIGGMSWESTAEYYRILNEGVRNRLGPTASARCMVWSFDFSGTVAVLHGAPLVFVRARREPRLTAPEKTKGAVLVGPLRA
jgi:hypothetical protein